MRLQVLDLVLRTFTTVVFATVAAYIAYQQWQTNRARVNADLFDRRWAVYEAFATFIAEVCGPLDLDLDLPRKVLTAFDADTRQVDFLFGEDVAQYRRELRSRGVHLGAANKAYRHAHETGEGASQETLNKMHEHSEWFVEQLSQGGLDKLFAKYMDMSKL